VVRKRCLKVDPLARALSGSDWDWLAPPPLHAVLGWVWGSFNFLTKILFEHFDFVFRHGTTASTDGRKIFMSWMPGGFLSFVGPRAGFEIQISNSNFNWNSCRVDVIPGPPPHNLGRGSILCGACLPTKETRPAFFSPRLRPPVVLGSSFRRLTAPETNYSTIIVFSADSGFASLLPASRPYSLQLA